MIDRNVMALAAKRVEARRCDVAAGRDAPNWRGASTGWPPICAPAGAVFMTEDCGAARAAGRRRRRAFRDLEAQATAAHFARLREGRATRPRRARCTSTCCATSSAINAHLVAAAAYPVLEAGGGLLASRLRQNPDTLDAADG